MESSKKKIGILGLSNPCKKERVEPVIQWLSDLGYAVDVSPYLYVDSSPKQRALIWNQWMKEDIEYIFDVSGGDLANETIPYLDFDAYLNSHTVFHGYSDLTCVLNALAPMRDAILFQICGNTNQIDIENYLRGNPNHLLQTKALGGNIRCLLKLAGTSYFPNLNGQPLFLESHSGNAYRIRTYFAQLEMMDVFSKVKSLTLGQFTQLDEEGNRFVLYEITKKYAIPIYDNIHIGHSKDSKAMIVGV